MSSAFLYRDGGLSAGPVPLAEVAAAVGTPAFVYSADAILARYRAMTGALAAEGLDATVCYAVKANPHLAVVRTLACEGAGADVVSEGELLRARTAGVPGERIVFAGVGKTEAEMAAGLEAGILQFGIGLIGRHGDRLILRAQGHQPHIERRNRGRPDDPGFVI